jgi:catechol 2,3-dioxygenase-like lactoylglutathione lyase family enzyme
MKLAHLGLCSLDTRELASWYSELLGLEIASDNGKDPPTLFLRTDDGAMIEVYPATTADTLPDNKRQGLRHLAFHTEDIEAARAALVERGVEIVDDLTTHPNGARTIFFRDPEGNLLHYLQR